MDPQITVALTNAKAILASIQTNMSIQDSARSSFVSQYNSRIDSELNSYINTMKDYSKNLIQTMDNLREEILSASRSLPTNT